MRRHPITGMKMGSHIFISHFRSPGRYHALFDPILLRIIEAIVLLLSFLLVIYNDRKRLTGD
jgi:hypothetical protein